MGGTGDQREGRSTPHHQIADPATGARAAGRHLGNDISLLHVLPDCGLLYDCLAPMAANGLHLRRHPVRRSRIGAAVAIRVFSHSLATAVTKGAVPEGPSDERSEERCADAVLPACGSLGIRQVHPGDGITPSVLVFSACPSQVVSRSPLTGTSADNQPLNRKRTHRIPSGS